MPTVVVAPEMGQDKEVVVVNGRVQQVQFRVAEALDELIASHCETIVATMEESRDNFPTSKVHDIIVDIDEISLRLAELSDYSLTTHYSQTLCALWPQGEVTAKLLPMGGVSLHITFAV